MFGDDTIIWCDLQEIKKIYKENLVIWMKNDVEHEEMLTFKIGDNLYNHLFEKKLYGFKICINETLKIVDRLI